MQVHVIGTGGTIASRQVGDAVVSEVAVADLLRRADLSGLDDSVEVRTTDLSTSPSFALGLPEVAELALLACRSLEEEGSDAVAVTHGTDSMEETVFLLDLLHTGEQPLAVTGAQRPDDHPEADGPRNLADLLRVVTSPVARAQGALLVFDGQAWPAVGVRKVHTSELRAFEAPSGPRLHVGADAVEAVGSDVARGAIPGALEAVREHGLPPVDVVATVPGSDGAALDAALERGARGIVLQGLGIGNASPADTEQVRAATGRGVPVVLTSRVGHGAVRPVYGGGGGVDLQRAGALFAGSQTTWQARILLSVALAMDAEAPADVVGPWLERHEQS